MSGVQRRRGTAARSRGTRTPPRGRLVVSGGNGSQARAHALHARGFRVVGIASTIDNDLHGGDVTIGVDTALNIALGREVEVLDLVIKVTL